jgi:hypothetical protein
MVALQKSPTPATLLHPTAEVTIPSWATAYYAWWTEFWFGMWGL